MRKLTVDVVGLESAVGLCSALSAFHPHLIKDENQIRVKVTGGNADIVAILNAIERHVRSRADGRASLTLDGQAYILEATSLAS